MKLIERWKYNRDVEKQNRVINILKRFWYPSMRKDFILALVLEGDFTSDELVQVSNLVGQEAHKRQRKENENV